MSDINEVRERLHTEANLYDGGQVFAQCRAKDVNAILADHARLQNKVAALHLCAWDRDECTVTLAFKSEQQVIEFIGQHPVRCRVQTLPAAAPAIDLEQFRPALEHARLSIMSAEKREEIERLLALIDGQAKPFVCTGDELRCFDGNGCECRMRGLESTKGEGE